MLYLDYLYLMILDEEFDDVLEFFLIVLVLLKEFYEYQYFDYHNRIVLFVYLILSKPNYYFFLFIKKKNF
jgi:hypothetical protein